MKRTLAILLALVMVLSMVPFAAFAEGAQTNTLVIGEENTAILDGSEEGVTYTWTATETGTLTITMPDPQDKEKAANGWAYCVVNDKISENVEFYYSDGYAADGETYVGVTQSQSLDVTKDDEISVYVNTLYSDAGTVVFTATFETAAGSESQPIVLTDSDTTDGNVITAAADIPAKKTMYYTIPYKVQDAILTVKGEGSFSVTVKGKTTQSAAAVDGVATLTGVSIVDMYTHLQIAVQNNNSEDMSAQLEFTFPAGHVNNPEVLTSLGELETQLAEGDSDGYNYIWTAAETGTVSFDIYTPKAELTADIVLTNQETGSSKTLSAEGVETVFGEELTYTTVSLDVEAGNRILITVSAIPVEGKYAAMTVESSGYFTAPTGTEDNPIDVQDNDDTDSNIITFDVEVPAGETRYYQIPRIQDMVLTVSGEGSFTVICGDESVAAVNGKVVIEGVSAPDSNTPLQIRVQNTGSQDLNAQMKFTFPVGTWDNPEALELDKPTTATIEAGTNGYYYSWTATESGVFTVTVDTENAENGWFYTVSSSSGKATNDHVSSPKDEEPVPSDSVEVNAGDVVKVTVNTYDAANVNSAPAGSVTITASFEAGEVTGGNSGSGVLATPDAPILVEYPVVTDGTLTVVISGTPGYVITVSDADGNTVGLRKESTTGAEQTLTYALKAGQYTIRMVGLDSSWSECSAYINYEVSFAVTEIGDGEQAEYEISETALVLGDNALTLLATAETTIYAFEPAETGVYTFTAPDGAVVGYWGAGSWFLSNPNSTTNTCEWTCTGVGQSAYIGVSGVEGEFNVNVAKTGDYEVVEIPTVTYENKATLSKFSLPTDAKLGNYVNVYGDTHTAVLGEDGYYHLDSADGDILLIDMDYQDIILSAVLKSDRPVMYAYVTNEDGSQVKYDIGNAVLAYEAVMDANGYYPLTEDLIFFYDVYANGASTWSFYLTDNTYNTDCVWMYCCRTVDKLDGSQGGEGGGDPDQPDQPDQPVGDGSLENPVVIEELSWYYGTVSQAEGDSDGYYYSYTAPAEGTITAYITEIPEGYVGDILLTNTTTNVTKILSEDGVDNYGLEVYMDVKKDDVILIQVIAKADAEGNEYPAAEFTWCGNFSYPEGSAGNPIYIEWNWDEAYANATASVTVGAGKTLYYTGVDGMILTIDGVESAQNEGVFSITNAGSSDATYALALATPVGESLNPEVIENIANFVDTRDLEEEASYYYIWTATENGKVVLDVTDGANITVERLTYTEDSEWPLTEQFALAESEYGEDGTASWNVAEKLEIEVTAGQELKIQVNALTDWSTWTAPAITYTLTTGFIADETDSDCPHNIQHVAAVEAVDCQTMGNLEYWHCDVCGKVWLDEARTQQTDMTSVKTYIEHEYYKACDTHCMNCGEKTNPNAAHAITHYAANAGDCQNIGNVEYWHCSYCGNAWLDEALMRQSNMMSIKTGTGDHNYVDGACTVCGAADPDYVAPAISFLYTAQTLSLKGEIYINSYLAFEDAEFLTKDYILENGGLLVWNAASYPGVPEEAVIGTQTHKAELTYSGPYEGHVEYRATTQGIPAKEYGDSVYFRSYVIVDGEYHYGDVKEYSVKAYCDYQITEKNDANLKKVLAALLNYGAAAQTYFEYKDTELVNADLQKYVDEGYLKQSDLELNWSDDHLTAATEPSEMMTVNFVNTNSFVQDNTLFLKGAVSVQYYMSIGRTLGAFENASEKIFYFWTAERYAELEAAGIALTKDNASYKVEAERQYTSQYGYEYVAKSDGIAARKLGDDLYAALCIKDGNGVEHCSGVMNYTPESYAAEKINDGNDEKLSLLMKWMVVYGERAKEYGKIIGWS